MSIIITLYICFNTMSKHLPWVPQLSIRPNSIVGYLVPQDGYYKNGQNKKSRSNLTQASYYNSTPTDIPEFDIDDFQLFPGQNITPEIIAKLNAPAKPTLKARTRGELSLTTTRKMHHLIDHFVAITPKNYTYIKSEKRWIMFKINFITLTLPTPQIHPDNVIKKICLQPFLDWLRKNCGVTHYIWKAELQKNGNIHFHITTNKFIPWLDIRYTWLSCVEKLGYLTAYQQGDDKTIPPCTEIRSVKNIRKFGAYLSKYIAKNPDQPQNKNANDNRSENQRGESIGCIWQANKQGGIERKPIEGRIYGASQTLSKLTTYKITEGDNGYWEVNAKLQAPDVKKIQLSKGIIYMFTLQQLVRLKPEIFGPDITDHYTHQGLSKSEATRLVYIPPT